MTHSLESFIDDLATTHDDGKPAVALVRDYRERANLADLLVEEAEIHGIELVRLPIVDDAMARLPALSAARNQAALLLIDAGAAERWAGWLEANREALPAWVRFIILLVMSEDLPVFARSAPAFMSWAKGTEVGELKPVAPVSAEEIERELLSLKEATGLSPAEFIEAWKRGDVKDTFRNNVWINLAYTALGGETR